MFTFLKNLEPSKLKLEENGSLRLVDDDKNIVLIQLEEIQSLESEHSAESQLTRLTEDLKKSEFLAKTRTAELQE